MTSCTALRVRYNECDPQGIVFNANYLTYVDIAVTQLWRELFGSYQRFLERTGVDIVLAEAGLRFRAAARFDDEVTVRLEPRMTSASSISTEATIARARQVLVEVRTRHVCVDAQALTKVPAPDDLVAALEAA